MEKFDAIIIGFGKGGKTLAAALGNQGQKVALIEKSKYMYGGTCINVGCIPTKSLVYSSENSAALGGDYEKKSEAYKTAILEKNHIITKLRQKNYEKLASNPNITVIDGSAKFTGPHTVSINGKYEIEGKNIVINTGSKSFIPDIKGLDESKIVHTSDTLLNLETLPENLVIIGGGYISLEFASIYANFGSNVTILQDSERFLPREDVEIAQTILKSLENRGIKILFNAKTEKINGSKVIFSVSGEQKEINADAVLIATGRRPDTTNLNVEAAGIELLPNRGIKTDKNLKSTAENIWAIGDVVGGLQFTYISLDDYRIVKSQLLGNGGRTTENRGVIPYSVFITPPFARVGLSEKEAVEKGFDITIKKVTPSAHPKAIILRNTEGLLKVIINNENNEILGVHLFCDEAHEMVNLFKLAMDNHIPYTVLKDNIYTHPSMTEIINELLT